MQHLKVSGAVGHIYIYIYIYVIRQLKVNEEKSAVLCDNCMKRAKYAVWTKCRVYRDKLLLRRRRTIRTAIISVVGSAENRKVPQLRC